MHKKISILLISLLLVSMSLAACGGEEAAAPAADSPQVTEPAPEAAEEDQAAETEEAEIMEEPTGEDGQPAEPAEEAIDAQVSEAGEEQSNQLVEPAGEGTSWLVMMYQDADDEILEEDIAIDLNEAEMVGSSDQVTIVSQIDRYAEGYDGDGDWTDTRRILVTYDGSGDLETINSEIVEELGEVNMGDPATLVEFATWAIQNYPAQKYALILSDHGAGWTGGWTDNDPVEGGELTLRDIDAALAEIVQQTGIGQLELIGFDACLMSQVDVYSAIAPYARYAVGSEETEPSLGWAYSSFLGDLVQKPEMNGAELAGHIVNSYIDQDGRIVDDEARAVLVDQVFTRSGNYSAERVAEEFTADITLTAVDLAAIKDLNAALNELVLALSASDQTEAIASARAYAQAYTSIFGEDTPASYLDLGSFIQLLHDQEPESEVAGAIEAVQQAIDSAVIAEKHGESRAGSTGFTFFFPNSQLYQNTTGADWLPYTTLSGRFAAASLWDDFLTYFYTGKEVDPQTADLSVLEPLAAESDFSTAIEASAPEPDAEFQKPGGGEVTFDSLEPSAEVIQPDEALTLLGEISGKNIGYIYIYTAYYDPDSDSYLTTDLDFIAPEETKISGGVAYPDWGDEDALSLEVDWEPAITLLSDGVSETFAAAQAETFGVGDEDTTYQVWGTYMPAGSDEGRQAFLRFDATGSLIAALVFTGDENEAAPREVLLQEGDIFIPEEEWLSFENDPDGEYEYYDGEPLTYAADGFTLRIGGPLSGSYQVGLIVEDLDGQTYENYVEVTVE